MNCGANKKSLFWQRMVYARRRLRFFQAFFHEDFAFITFFLACSLVTGRHFTLLGSLCECRVKWQ